MTWLATATCTLSSLGHEVGEALEREGRDVVRRVAADALGVGDRLDVLPIGELARRRSRARTSGNRRRRRHRAQAKRRIVLLLQQGGDEAAPHAARVLEAELLVRAQRLPGVEAGDGAERAGAIAPQLAGSAPSSRAKTRSASSRLSRAHERERVGHQRRRMLVKARRAAHVEHALIDARARGDERLEPLGERAFVGSVLTSARMRSVWRAAAAANSLAWSSKWNQTMRNGDAGALGHLLRVGCSARRR